MLSDVEHRATVRQSQRLHPVRDYPGWAHLLNALSEAVELHEQHSEAAQWQVTLLAEKLGRLRIEASGGRHPYPGARAVRSDREQPHLSAVRGARERAENRRAAGDAVRCVLSGRAGRGTRTDRGNDPAGEVRRKQPRDREQATSDRTRPEREGRQRSECAARRRREQQEPGGHQDTAGGGGRSEPGEQQRMDAAALRRSQRTDTGSHRRAGRGRSRCEQDRKHRRDPAAARGDIQPERRDYPRPDRRRGATERRRRRGPSRAALGSEAGRPARQRSRRWSSGAPIRTNPTHGGGPQYTGPRGGTTTRRQWPS